MPMSPAPASSTPKASMSARWPISPKQSRSAHKHSFAHFWRGISRATKGDHAGAIEDFTKSPRVPSQGRQRLFLPRAQLRGQGRPRHGHRRFHQGDRDTSPTTRWPTASAPRPTPTRVTATTPLPTSPGPSSSIRRMSSPIVTPRRDPRAPGTSTIVPSPISRKALALDPRNAGNLRRSRAQLCGQGRSRACHRRLHSRHRHRSEEQVGVQQPCGQLRRHRRARSGHCRLQHRPGAAGRDRRRSPMAEPGARAHRPIDGDEPAGAAVTQAAGPFGSSTGLQRGPLDSRGRWADVGTAWCPDRAKFVYILGCSMSWAAVPESTRWHTRALIWTCGRRAPPLPRGRRLVSAAGPAPAERAANGAGDAAGERRHRSDRRRRHRAGLLQLRLRRRPLPRLAGCAARASAARADAGGRRRRRAGRARHPRRHPAARDGGGDRRGDARRRPRATGCRTPPPHSRTCCGALPTRPPGGASQPACTTCSGPCWAAVPDRPRPPS